MKAGAFTPAIQVGFSVLAMAPSRSMKAGAFTPAIPSMTMLLSLSTTAAQ